MIAENFSLHIQVVMTVVLRDDWSPLKGSR